MSCQAVTYRDTGLAGLTGKLSKRDTCRRWEVALFCFSSFLLSAHSCLPNYRVSSRQADRAGTQTRARQKTLLRKPTKEAEEAATCMK